MEIDEWVSKRSDYSYSMSVNNYGTDFWVFNHKTENGQRVKSVDQIDEIELEGVLCEKSEVQK